MAGSTNFQQWNPTQANQETDAEYTSDSQRTGGAPNGTPFPSATGNKLFYQTSTGITALMEMMAAKGFTCNDTDLATLASVLSAIQTTADLKNPIQTLTYSSSINCNCASYSGFQIPLNGNTALGFTGASPGQIILLIFVNDGAGNHTIVWPGNVTGGPQPDKVANNISAMLLAADNTGVNFRALTPMVSNTGINGTIIGAGNPLAGNFTTVGASSVTTSALTVNGNASITGNSTVGGTLQANKVLASESSGTAGGFSFTQDSSQDTGMFSSGDGEISFINNGSITCQVTGSQWTFSTAVDLSAGAYINGGTLVGTFAGNPTLSGTVATNVVTTNTPASNDSSIRVPNTSWVQALVASAISAINPGFAISLASNGYIKFGNLLGGLILMWGQVTVDINGGQESVAFPTDFPNSCFNVTATTLSVTDRITYIVNGSVGNNGFTISNNGSSGYAYWLAIGH